MSTNPELNRRQPPIDWLAVMDAAIALGDERGMWNALYQHHDGGEAHRRMSDLVPRLLYRLDNAQLRMVELFLVPVISSQSHSFLSDERAWKQYGECVADALHSWFQLADRMHTFSGVRPYDWVGSWRPAVLREHLLSVMPGSRARRLEFDTTWLHLPPEAPRLGFIMVTITSARRFVRLAAEAQAKDSRFKAVLAGLFQRREGDEPVVILRPDHVQHAIASGLTVWLDELHRAVPITGWTVTPHLKHLDVVKVSLQLASADVPLMQFPMRKHQAGLVGITSVLTHLSTLAPMLDQPMDTRERLIQPATGDLS